MFQSDAWMGVPGLSTAKETYENEYTFGRWVLTVNVGEQIDGTARDSGNSPTTNLRPGLLLGQIAATGNLKQWSASATDGSQRVFGILATGIRMQDLDGNNVNRFVPVTIAGPVQAAKLIGLNDEARAQMRGRFLFDDEGFSVGSPRTWSTEVAKTADYTVDDSDSGTLFTNTGALGAVIFTLPAIEAGLYFEFLAVADFGLTVASAEGDNMVTSNDASADSVGFVTGGDIIGGRVAIASNMAGTKWYVTKLSDNAMTIVS